MGKQLRTLILAFLVIRMGLPYIISAQGEKVIVPDLTGLSVPQAAAQLNRIGLNLGFENPVPWMEASGLPQNKINGQSVSAGQQIPKLSAIDVIVSRITNIILLYDYDGLTLVNKTGLNLDLTDLKLNSFAATTWQVSQIADGQCAQIWAISKRAPENISDCTNIQTWLFSTNEGLHFWRSTPESAHFTFSKGGVEYGVCNAAVRATQPMRCDIYLPENAQDDLTDYIFFAYTAEQLTIRNNSADAWMPVGDVIIINNLTAVKGFTFLPGDANSYAIRAPVGRVDKLAPNQCIWFTNRDPALIAPPQTCDVIAKLDVDPTLIFWASDFGVDGALDTKPHLCPKATVGKLTICVMPR